MITSDTYIDIHTHQSRPGENGFSILSLVKPKEWETGILQGNPLSIGIHPWYLDEGRAEDELRLLKRLSAAANVLAIGECGIDLLRGPSVDIQERIFREQAKLAENTRRPLIIHNVKATQHFLRLIKELKPQSPWIFHGYNGNTTLTNELVQAGAYFSIGHRILQHTSAIRKSISQIPADRMFFETDEWPGAVSNIYAEAARLLFLPEEELILQVIRNFLSCFRDLQTATL